MKERLFTALRNNEYEFVKTELARKSLVEQKELLLEYSYTFESIDILGFLDFLQENGWEEKHILLWRESILVNALCHIEGAYALGLYCAQKLYQLDANIINLKGLLFYNEIPEKLISDEKAQEIMKEILQKDSKTLIQ